MFVTELAMDPEAAVFFWQKMKMSGSENTMSSFFWGPKAEFFRVHPGNDHSQENVRDFWPERMFFAADVVEVASGGAVSTGSGFTTTVQDADCPLDKKGCRNHGFTRCDSGYDAAG